MNPYGSPQQPRFAPHLTGPLGIVVPPSGQLLHRSEIKNHSRIDADLTEDDNLVDRIIRRATEYCEQEVTNHRQFLTAVYELPLERWWNGALRFPRAPLRRVLGVTYYDSAGVKQTLSSSAYLVQTPWRGAGSIERAPGQSFPNYQCDRRLPIAIQFLAGYCTPLTVAGNVLTASGLVPAAGDLIRFSNSGGSLPSPLQPLTNYFVVSPSGSSFQVSATSGGSAITLADSGSGFSFAGELPEVASQAINMLAAAWYENREAFVLGQAGQELTFSISSLLSKLEYGGYK